MGQDEVAELITPDAESVVPLPEANQLATSAHERAPGR